MTGVLCYELNEVPWRVLDLYVDRRPRSNVAKLLTDAAQITTHTSDSGELHPWSTWPTMHRGVTNDVHNIRFINQDRSCADGTPPLWELVAESGKTVGIAGCLQSYPPLRRQEVLFHIPDTFSPGADAQPKRYERFQSINLELTGENRAVQGRLSAKDLVAGLGLLGTGVSVGSAAQIALHLAREKLNPLHRARRPIMQAHLAFDVFMDALKRSTPTYAAVFSNHVAGMMHRYWKQAFPDDFGLSSMTTKADRFHSGSILAAMDIFDAQLGRLLAFAKDSYDVVIASSMGQEAIERGEYHPELLLKDVGPLAGQLGFERPVRMNLAMQPDVALEFQSEVDLEEFRSLLPEFTDTLGGPVLVQRYPAQGRTLNLSLVRSPATVQSETLLFRGRRIQIELLGLRLISRDQGTGYHQPKGILIWRGAHQPKVAHRQEVDSRQYAPTILRAIGVNPPEYMMPAIGSRVPLVGEQLESDAPLPQAA
jgi:hypothetical protein